MKKETEEWLKFADENLKSAEILLENGLYNPSLQNAQQAIEKYLKSIMIEIEIGSFKTHSIREIVNKIYETNISIDISDDDIDLIDSIYLPTKYPLVSVLPEFVPDYQISKYCLDMAVKVKDAVKKKL